MATFDINNTARRAQYTSTGQAGPFAFNFQVNASSELKVYIDDVEKTESTHYTVTLNADGTGFITFNSATTSGELITIIGDQPLSRTTVFQTGQANNPTTLETEFDNVIIRQQQIKEITDRALQLKPTTPRTVTGSGLSGPIYFPYDATVANNADRIIKYNAAGTGLEIGSTTTNIDTLAGIASDISNVSSISADVTSVAADAADIGVVSTNIASVNTVATNINDVIKVADDLNEAVSEVETVANDLNEAVSEIDTVGNNITYVQTVGDSTNIANITTVAGQITPTNNISTLAGIDTEIQGVYNIRTNITNVDTNSTNVNLVAGQISPTNNISTLAAISANITQAASDSADIQKVASDSADIRALADIEDGTTATNAVSNAGNNVTSIATVAGQISPTNNISSLAAITADITSVANIDSDVTAVANDSTDIGIVATDLAGSDNIGTVATDIVNVNLVGGSIGNVNTVGSNIGTVNEFGERYRVSATAPTTSLDIGDLYYDTATDTMRVYGSSGWQNAGSSVNGTSQRYNYTATSGQTTFTGADNNGNTLTYDAGYIDVYLNGVKLLNGTDVTVTSGSSVVLASGATTGDVVDIVAYGTFSVASLNADNLDSGTVPDARITGAYTGITGLTINTDATGITVRDASESEDRLEVGVTAGASAYLKTSISSGSLELQAGNVFLKNTSGTSLLRAYGAGSTTGDIAFYEDTGTTPKFYWDASAERLGIGTSSPESTLHVVGTSDLQSPIKVNAPSASGVTLISDRYVANESFSNIGLAHSGGALVLGSFVKPSDSSESDATGYLSSFDAGSVKRSAIKIDGGDGQIKFLTTNTSATVAVDTAVAMTERVRIHSNGVTAFNDGIALGVGVNNTSSNVLDDYEEGTFTPEFADASSGGNVATTTDTVGEYVKIGNQVTVYIHLLNINTSGLTSGNGIVIRNLPFTVKSNNIGTFGSVFLDRFNFTNYVVSLTGANTSNIFLKDIRDSNTDIDLTVASVTTSGGSDLSITHTYQTT